MCSSDLEVQRLLSSSDTVKFFTSTLYLSSEGTFISSFAGRPRIFSYPRTRYWVWPFLTQVVHMRLDIGPGLLQCNLNTGYQLAPTVIKLASNWNKIFRNISITNISTYLGSCSLSIVNDILQNTCLKSISLVVNFWNNYSKPT